MKKIRRRGRERPKQHASVISRARECQPPPKNLFWEPSGTTKGVFMEGVIIFDRAKSKGLWTYRSQFDMLFFMNDSSYRIVTILKSGANAALGLYVQKHF